MAVLASAVWRVRPSGSNTNGAGYDSGISGAGTDYSQQNTAQLALTDVTVTGTGINSATGGFTSAMIGNAAYITGTGTTTGWYFVTAVADTNNATIDRSAGTGPTTNSTFNLGGAWADPFGAHITSTGPMVAGNTCYIYGGGTDNPGTADYSTTTFRTPTAGNTTAGYVRFIGENGRPRIDNTAVLTYFSCVLNTFENLYFVATGTGFPAYGFTHPNGSSYIATINCSFDQNGRDVACFGITSNGCVVAINCEMFSSSGASTGANYAVSSGLYTSLYINCNIHDTHGPGFDFNNAGYGGMLISSIVSKCGGIGVRMQGTSTTIKCFVIGCTIDGNASHGINIGSTAILVASTVFGNLITNHTTASTYGINVAAGTTAVNDRSKGYLDFNYFYNNTSNFNNLSASPHDDTSNTDPQYTNQATGDYTLQSSSPVIGAGFPAGANPSLPIGATPAYMSTLQPEFLRRGVSPDVTNYMDWGAVQRVMGSGGGLAIPVLGRIVG